MKQKILNAIIIIGFIWTALATIYTTAIPPEIKAKLPYVSTLTLVFTGAASTTVSSILVYVKEFVRKEKTFNVKINKDLREMVIKQDKATNEKIDFLLDLIAKQDNNIESLTNERNVKNKIDIKNGEKLNRLINLISVSLESTKSNPLADKDIVSKIEEVLYNEKEK